MNKNTLTSIAAVVAGFVAVFVLSLGTDVVMHIAGVFPQLGQPMSDALFVLATLYRTVYCIAGGYIAARLAPNRPMEHALVLSVLGLIVSITGAVVTWNKGPAFGPHWYPLALIVTAIPCAWVCGRLRIMQLHTR